jgi:hypothetical protein
MSSIITTTDLAGFMNQTLNSTQATDVVAAINEYVETETHRFWGGTKQVTETYDWKRVLWLRHMDVVSVDQIQVGFPNTTRTTLTTQSYWFNPYGRVTLFWNLLPASLLGGINTTSMLLNDYMAVTYTYGVTTVPDDLKNAALGIAANFYNWATNGQKDIVAAQIGNYRLQFSGSVRGVGGGPDGNAPPVSNSTLQLLFNTVSKYKMQRQ